MTHLTLRLSGPAHACSAVTQALAAIPCLGLPVVWTLDAQPGRCIIRERGRSTVASSWERAVDLHLMAPVPLRDVRVKAPSGRWM